MTKDNSQSTLDTGEYKHTNTLVTHIAAISTERNVNGKQTQLHNSSIAQTSEERKGC